MHRVNYKETACVLLHDIGKVFQRYIARVREKLEGLDESIKDYIKVDCEVKNHEEIGRDVVNKVTDGAIDLSICKFLFKNIIALSDQLAAAERGIPSDYSLIAEKWSEIESSLGKSLKASYNYYQTPLLSPLWVAKLSGYEYSTGPCARSSYRFDDAVSKIIEYYVPIINGVKTRSVENVVQGAVKLISELMDERLWIPTRLLSAVEIKQLKPVTYIEAQKKIDYCSISKHLVDGLRILVDVYKPHKAITRGFVDTLNELLKYTTLTVPAAVYMALPPDTSLYSHSKIAAAYASAISIIRGKISNISDAKFRVMIVDTRRIQDFIASPVVAKAASRVIRGRSLLVELVTMSLVHYILELYGGLPYTNVLTSEGGTLDIIIPKLDDTLESKIIKAIRSHIQETYKRLHGLPFTIALSEPFGLGDTNFFDNLDNISRGISKGFVKIQDELERKLAKEKIKDDASFRLDIDEDNIAGFDAITKETVTKDEVFDYYGLVVGEENKEYADSISGGKLSIGDVISEATHLSLVAGSCLRNAILLMSLYSYSTSQDEPSILVPDKERIRSIVEQIQHVLFNKTGESTGHTQNLKQLYMKVPYRGWDLSISIIPIETLGSVHILFSVPSPHVIAVEKPGEQLSPRMIAIGLALEIIEKLHERGLISGYSRVELRLVNTAYEFISILDNRNNKNNEVKEKFGSLVEKNIDIHLGTIFFGTFHPYKLEKTGEELHGISLVDLDAYNLISMSKSDADNLGEVKKIFTLSPTRLTMLSDFLTLFTVYKTHLVAIDYAYKHKQMISRGPIILYAGGDDIAVYGYWIDVLLFLGELYREVFPSLYPLSFTTAIVIERSDYPLLELYLKVIDRLSSAKKEARGWIHIAELSSPRLVRCGSNDCVDKESYKIIQGLPPAVDHFSAKCIKICSPLESFSSLIEALNKLEAESDMLSHILNYKRELMIISMMANMDTNTIDSLAKMLQGLKTTDLKSQYDVTRRAVLFSHISARRSKDFSDLENIIRKITGSQQDIILCHREGEDALEALNRAICSKTFIDVLLLYMNPRSREINI